MGHLAFSTEPINNTIVSVLLWRKRQHLTYISKVLLIHTIVLPSVPKLTCGLASVLRASDTTRHADGDAPTTALKCKIKTICRLAHRWKQKSVLEHIIPVAIVYSLEPYEIAFTKTLNIPMVLLIQILINESKCCIHLFSWKILHISFTI